MSATVTVVSAVLVVSATVLLCSLSLVYIVSAVSAVTPSSVQPFLQICLHLHGTRRRLALATDVDGKQPEPLVLLFLTLFIAFIEPLQV